MLNEDLCATKITKLQDTTGWVQQQILRLDIPVTNTLGMDVREGSEQLIDV